MPRGGKREGAGRKVGSKTSNYTTSFYARCTEQEKEFLRFTLEWFRQINNDSTKK